jgi:hypothetical protein
VGDPSHAADLRRFREWVDALSPGGSP